VSPIECFPPEKWDAVLAVDLSSAFHTTRAVFAGMKARKWGRIVNMASAHGLIASPFKAAYVAAKHGLVGLTKVTALEGAEANVTCNAICPGYVWTPLVEKQIGDQEKAHGATSIGRPSVALSFLQARYPLLPCRYRIAAFNCASSGVAINAGLIGCSNSEATGGRVDAGWLELLPLEVGPGFWKAPKKSDSRITSALATC